jgi:uncharacterized protein
MAEPEKLTTKVSEYVEEYMSHYDGSHDFQHVKRVLGLAHLIYRELTSPSDTPSSSSGSLESAQLLDPLVITLSALLHECAIHP